MSDRTDVNGNAVPCIDETALRNTAAGRVSRPLPE